MENVHNEDLEPNLTVHAAVRQPVGNPVSEARVLGQRLKCLTLVMLYDDSAQGIIVRQHFHHLYLCLKWWR